jgi:catechol 2,3-dioxygenase-like lactoylglutathione lyase family enzyme
MANTRARFAFALDYVKDMDATKRFFVDVLGLELDRDAPTFAQFRDQAGNAYAIASDEPMDPKHAGVPELWWLVDDADTAFGEMSSKAQVSLPPRQMPFGKCFGIKDPNGQVHYVLELAQVRPSQPVG